MNCCRSNKIGIFMRDFLHCVERVKQETGVDCFFDLRFGSISSTSSSCILQPIQLRCVGGFSGSHGNYATRIGDMLSDAVFFFNDFRRSDLFLGWHLVETGVLRYGGFLRPGSIRVFFAVGLLIALPQTRAAHLFVMCLLRLYIDLALGRNPGKTNV